MQRSIRKNQMSRLSCCFHNILPTSFRNVQVIQTRYKGYYSVLGLSKKATAAEIKDAYYKLSFKYHPDRNDGSEASAAQFRQICEAYEILSDKDKKQKYDSQIFHSEFARGSYDRNDPLHQSPIFRKREPPRTGRTRDFDYDRHFREHYRDEYYRDSRPHPIYYRRQMKLQQASKVLILVCIFITIYVINSTISITNNPPPPKRIYYHHNSKEDSK